MGSDIVTLSLQVPVQKKTKKTPTVVESKKGDITGPNDPVADIQPAGLQDEPVLASEPVLGSGRQTRSATQATPATATQGGATTIT